MAKRPPGTPAAVRAQVAQRRTQAIDLRQAGVDPVTIGRQLRYGRWTENPDGTWTQQSSDASISRMVRKDIDRGLADRRAGLHEAADELVQQMTERLERLRAALWPAAVKGNIGAARECRAIDAQLAQLNGWNKPVRHEVDLPSARREVLDAVSELVALAATSDIDLSLALVPATEGAAARD